jgi:hypothetical protein
MDLVRDPYTGQMVDRRTGLPVDGMSAGAVPAARVNFMDRLLAGSGVSERIMAAHSLFNPVTALAEAGQQSQVMFDPATTPMGRVAALGGMLTGMAGTVAPMWAASKGAVPTANAMVDALTGINMPGGEFLADEFGGALAPALGDPVAARGAQIMDMLKSGRAKKVTDEMLDMGDPTLNARLSEYLYQNYDLPMDEASRMARAKGMGNTEDYYKGMYPYDADTGPVRNYKGEVIDRADSVPQEITAIDRPSDFPTFNKADPKEPGYKIAGVMGRDVNVANNFASWGESAVLPLKVKHGRTFDMDATGIRAGDTHFDEVGRPFRDAMRSGEYDTGVIRNTTDEGSIAFALRPENIRSRFARFDPRLAHLKNLSASVAGLAAIFGVSEEEMTRMMEAQP